ncbi:metal ABC transporter ATP-binding protein [Methylocella sp.]|uniref:metal ABC transporter ATP-binding protein n=1 Tax=Methylocella sp. TaxID=1978226 RepID=UPI003782F427
MTRERALIERIGTAPAALTLENVTIAYDRHPAVHHVSCVFAPGSLTAIVGPNGAGKSTLLKAIVGEAPLSQGRIMRSAGAIAYLPQAAEIDRRFPLCVAEVVLLGAWREIGAFGATPKNVALRAREALEQVGLKGFERRPIGSLSVGQLQRVLFARLIVQDAQVILLDEPFAAVDARTTRDLLAVVRAWHEEGRAILAVAHDLAQVRAHFPQTLLLAREKIAFGPTETTLSEANLRRAEAAPEAELDHAPVCAGAA